VGVSDVNTISVVQ